MRVVDANVLLYAVNTDAQHHEPSRTWLDSALTGQDSVGLTWVVLLAFLRLATKIELFPHPLTVPEALTQVDDWLSAPGAQLIHPSSDHLLILERLLTETGGGGNLVNDAHLAAIAVEQRAEIVSYDGDFARFAGVRWRRPEQLLR